MDFVVKWVSGTSCSAFSISLPKCDLVSFFEQLSNTSAWGKLLDTVGHGRTWSYSFCNIEPLDVFEQVVAIQLTSQLDHSFAVFRIFFGGGQEHGQQQREGDQPLGLPGMLYRSCVLCHTLIFHVGT